MKTKFLAVCTLLFLLCGTAHADLTTGLVASYPFNGNANDESGNGNNGTVYGATLTADRFGNANSAYIFDGTNDYISLGDVLDLLDHNISINVWVNLSNYSGMMKIINKGQTTCGTPPDSGYSIRILEDELRFQIHDDERIDLRSSIPTSTLPIDSFVMITGVMNREASSASSKLYVNNSLIASSSATLGNSDTNIELSFGALNRGSCGAGIGEFFRGTMDDVRIYNRALSTAEIQELYQEGTTKQLTITKTGTGNGTVTSNPAGINCGTDCTEKYTTGTTVSLIATPINGSTFNGFSGDADCTDKSVTMNADKTCIATFTSKPIAVTNPASNITQTSATLNGNVISTGATATTSFDFGTTTTYGTNIAATPSQVYSSTAVAINANNTDLACNTTYNFRTKAINSAGTGYGTNQSFTTAACVVNSWLYPANLIVTKNQPFALDVIAKSDGVSIGNYEFVLTIDPNVLRLDTTYCNQGICPGTSALTNNIVYANTTTGVVSIIGQGGETPSGNDLQLLKIHFKSRLTPGLTPISLVTNKLATLDGDTIGLGARGATVAVSPGLCGDADGNNAVNIVDALAIARKLVGLPPPPTIDEVLADVNVNKDGVSIADALQIARYSIGLLLPPEVCKIGQPLSPV
jgi:hypothetical protein